MISDYLILDVATAALPNVAGFIDTPKPRKGTKDEAKIAAQIEAKIQAEIDGAGLDPDLCQITGIAFRGPRETGNYLASGNVSEKHVIERALVAIRPNTVLVGFNSRSFDWPVLIRRCQYLGITPPDINLDRYRTPHIDLYDRLSQHGAIDAHSLGFYVRRHGWTDLVKPLSGEEESKVIETGKWSELSASLNHDVEATYRLAKWLGVVA